MIRNVTVAPSHCPTVMVIYMGEAGGTMVACGRCLLPITVRGPLDSVTGGWSPILVPSLAAIAHERAQCLKDGPLILL
jgi:hypothetical protein